MASTSAAAPAGTVTTQPMQATEVKEYRHDFPADPPNGNDKVEIELDWLIVGEATRLEIFCDRPYRVWYSHPHEKRGDYEPWPRDPLPMGITTKFDNTGWKKVIVRPYLFPAKLRIWMQRNAEVTD